MEFKFNVNEVFGEPIVEIGSNLVPPGFTGDRRALWNTVGKVMEVVNALGEASAAAQGLTKPITTADRLRNSEHKIYLLIDQSANGGQGAVTGMLKTGQKGLYVFDREGQHHQVSPPCVLDFYVHESRQRTGLGRQLFEHMLQKEEIQPVKMAIDRPSEKFLGFLNKHYHLNQPIKQMNNYVVFDGFFEGDGTNSCADNNNSGTPRKPRSLSGANGLQTITSYGRYSAPRPACSMGQIIHNQSSTVQKPQEAQGLSTQSAPALVQQDYVNSLQTGSLGQCQNQSSEAIPNAGYLQENPQMMMVNNFCYPQAVPLKRQVFSKEFISNDNIQMNGVPIGLESPTNCIQEIVQEPVQQNPLEQQQNQNYLSAQVVQQIPVQDHMMVAVPRNDFVYPTQNGDMGPIIQMPTNIVLQPTGYQIRQVYLPGQMSSNYTRPFMAMPQVQPNASFVNTNCLMPPKMQNVPALMTPPETLQTGPDQSNSLYFNGNFEYNQNNCQIQQEKCEDLMELGKGEPQPVQVEQLEVKKRTSNNGFNERNKSQIFGFDQRVEERVQCDKSDFGAQIASQ